ncbi:MAG: hypothetical protein K1X77_11235, partial [Bacteroidia bacterium]|nr:hypothetical protein [Bacteroidia bacterium]
MKPLSNSTFKYLRRMLAGTNKYPILRHPAKRCCHLFFLFVLVFANQASIQAQSFLLGDGGAVINNVCSGVLVEPGGYDDYPPDQDVVQTFCATSGQCLRFTVTEFDTQKDFDLLSIYDGSSTTAELLFTNSGNMPTNTVITSTSNSGGCLTFHFESDGFNQSAGFKGTFSCVTCPASPEIVVLGENPGTLTTCGAIIRDPGGSGNYNNDLQVQQTICAGNANECLRVSFVEFETERGKDFLKIYDGSSTFGPLLADYSGDGVPLPVSSTSASGGCLTFVFTSNQTYNRTGFKANVGCLPCQPPERELVLGQAGRVTVCEGVIVDPGGNSAIPPNQNVQQTFCSGTGQCLQLSFSAFDLEKDFDFIKVYDGPDNFSEQIAEFTGNDMLPPPIIGSTNSGGCLTVAFLSNASGFNNGFRAKVSCVPCIPPPVNVVMGRGGATVTSCGGILLDPGGYGSYSDNQSVTQTICSGTEKCVRLTFTDFNTETNADNLKIFDGPSADPSTLLGVFSGGNKPLPVESSIQSGGCLTLQFTSNGAVTKSGFSAIISCQTCVDPYPIPTGKCQDARGFCTDNGTIDFPAGSNVESPFGAGNAGRIGCLGSTPNPAWYYMNVSRSGPININIMGSEDGGVTATNDVDFICWGPFATREEICSKASDRVYADDPVNIVDCSYSPDPTESCEIPNAIVGEWYMLLLTNFSNRPSNIYFRQSNAAAAGSGQTNCALFCNIEVNTTVGACNPATNTYTLSGELEIINPPASGNLIVTNSSGGMISIPAPFSSPVPFSFANLASDGAVNQVTAYFSENVT